MKRNLVDEGGLNYHYINIYMDKVKLRQLMISVMMNIRSLTKDIQSSGRERKIDLLLNQRFTKE